MARGGHADRGGGGAGVVPRPRPAAEAQDGVALRVVEVAITDRPTLGAAGSEGHAVEYRRAVGQGVAAVYPGASGVFEQHRREVAGARPTARPAVRGGIHIDEVEGQRDGAGDLRPGAAAIVPD